MTKTIKIKSEVHRDLKQFSAITGISMEEVANVAISERLKKCGYKFPTKIKSTK